MNAPALPPPRILALGSISADSQVLVDAPLDGSATATGRERCRLGGGKAANVAVVASMLGCQASLLGRVGDDALASQALRRLGDLGIDLDAVRRASGERRALSFTDVPDSRAQPTVLADEVNLGYADDDIAAVCDAIEAANPASLLVVDYEISPRAASQAVRTAHRRGLRIVIDPSFAHAADRAALRLADALTVSESEAKALTGVHGRGETAAAAAAQALAALGTEIVCVQLEGGGCLLRHKQHTWRVGSHPSARTADPNGAGDRAFTGAFAVALFEGQAAPQAAAFAVAVSELAVARYRGQASFPSRESVRDQLRGGRFAGSRKVET